jgi:hypothetical protein
MKLTELNLSSEWNAFGSVKHHNVLRFYNQEQMTEHIVQKLWLNDS